MDKTDVKDDDQDRDELVKKAVENVDSNELFDMVLREAGGMGRYQKFLLALSIFVSLTAACNHLSPIYLAYAPRYKCVQGNWCKLNAFSQFMPNITYRL